MTAKGFDTSQAKQVASDMGKLRATIRAFDSLPGRLDDHEEGHLRAFTGMLDDMQSGKRTKLTEKQRGYLDGVYQRIAPRVASLHVNDSTTPVTSLVPEVLRHLPKKPPQKIAR